MFSLAQLVYWLLLYELSMFIGWRNSNNDWKLQYCNGIDTVLGNSYWTYFYTSLAILTSHIQITALILKLKIVILFGFF